MLAGTSLLKLRPAPIAAATCIVFTVIFSGNLFRFTVGSIPFVIIAAAGAIRLIDKKTETAGTWVIRDQANAFAVFENAAFGIEFRMSNQWFALLYPCSSRPPGRTFGIKAEQQDGNRRTVVSTASFGNSTVLKLDGPPIHPAEGQTPVFGIVRK